MATMLSKKIMILCLALCFMVFGGACMTSMMWSAKDYDTKYTSERVGSFLVSQDNKKIVVLGSQHHYVFKFDDRLKTLLASPLRSKLQADFGTFFVYTDSGRVNGGMSLYIPANTLTKQQKERARKLRMYPKKLKNGQSVLRFGHRLNGKRYVADKFVLPKNMRYLNNTYTVKVAQKTPTNKNIPLKVLATPVALTADGVLTLLGVPLLIIIDAFQ